MSNFESILNFSNYYKKCDIESGIHGPEVHEDKLYISIYHYLQYLNEDPHNYDTLNLGLYLFSKSATLRKCKYECQNFEIDKYNLELLKTERTNFEKYKKVKNIETRKPINKSPNVSQSKYKQCASCGEWHDASFAFCAPCNGKSRRDSSYEDDYF
jgi:hypothetical protein